MIPHQQTDEELVALAARAYGRVHWDAGLGCWIHGRAGDGEDATRRWDPVESDADIFRMAVELNIGFLPRSDQDKDCAVVLFNARYTGLPDGVKEIPMRMVQPHDGDVRRATRRAVLRAAAEMGERL